MNERKKGVVLSYVCILVKLVVGLLYVPILLGYLSDSEYGLYQLMGSLISYLAVMDFGLSATVIRYYTVYRTKRSVKDAENVLGIAQRIYGVISAFALIICIVIYFLIDILFGSSLSLAELNEAKHIFIVLTINVLLTLSTNVYISILNSYEKFSLLKILDIFNSIFQLLFIGIAMQISKSALSVVIMMLIINAITALVKIMYSRYKLKVRIKYHYRDKNLIKEMLSFSVSVFVVSVVDMIYWKTDQVILGAVSGTVAVAIYGVASQIYWNYMPLSTAVQSVFLPSITKKVADGVDNKTLSDLFIRVGRIQFIVLGCVLSGFIVLGKEFITILAGSDYINAYWICLIIMIPFTIDLIQNMGINIMQAKNMYSFRAKVYIFAACGNIILTLVLAKPLEGIGCAIASALCMIISNGIVMNWFYYRKLKIDIPLFWKNIMKIASVDLVLIIVFLIFNRKMYFMNIYMDFLIKGCIFVIVYCLLIWSISMNDYERNLLKRAITNVKR